MSQANKIKDESNQLLELSQINLTPNKERIGDTTSVIHPQNLTLEMVNTSVIQTPQDQERKSEMPQSQINPINIEETFEMSQSKTTS